VFRHRRDPSLIRESVSWAVQRERSEQTTLSGFDESSICRLVYAYSTVAESPDAPWRPHVTSSRESNYRDTYIHNALTVTRDARRGSCSRAASETTALLKRDKTMVCIKAHSRDRKREGLWDEIHARASNDPSLISP